MKLINDDRTDLSLEANVVIAAVMNMVYGAEIAAYRLSDALDAIGEKGTLMQRKKQALNTARRNCQAMIFNLETAFDKSFDQVVTRAGEEYIAQRDAEFHALACEVLDIVIIFLSVSEGLPYEKRMNIFKALLNFKVTSEVNLPALRKFFRFKEG